MSLKIRTIQGLKWSFIDNLFQYGITFIIGIILARLLTPEEFGLIGMVTIFIAISQSFISGGLGDALIRKKEYVKDDYSTVFYFNFLASVVFYLLLFSSAEWIGKFFQEPQLKSIIRVLGIRIIVGAFSIIQQTILIKNINFKILTKVSIVANLTGGSISIILAIKGFGVWSLVAKSLIQSIVRSILLWIVNDWKLFNRFNVNSFKELFGFGYKLLLSNLLETIYRNVYLITIGKYFSAADLGYYTRADYFKNLPSQNLTNVVQRVSYPVLSSIQDDKIKLKLAYKRLVKSIMLLSFILMIGLAAIAKPLIVTLIGDKWLPSVPYLQLLCFVGMLYPIHALNLNILNVQGRSDLFLKLEIIKKFLAVPVILSGILWGINTMIVGMIINSLIGYYLNSYYSGKQINYSIVEQIRDILPSLTLSLLVGTLMYLIGIIFNINSVVMLAIQVCSGIILFLGICELFEVKDYLYIKDIVIERIKTNVTNQSGS